MSAPTSRLDDDACYLALKTRDARFDGRFFTGVRSTGIYCRPVCKVRTPRAENCSFFALAAQAEAAGFRPCLRCRPELAPALAHSPVWSTQDASAMLAQQAAALLDAQLQSGQAASGLGAVAQRLGVSERHLRRIFEAQWGIAPLQYLQTRRLLCAKQLLTDTRLPMAQVAQLSGFGSLRRFNAAFVAHYRLQPRALRSARPGAPGATAAPGIVLRASYRPPYDVQNTLAFLQQRAIAGVESVDLEAATYQRTLALQLQGEDLRGWVQARFVRGSCSVELCISESLLAALPRLVADMRQLLDLDADPGAIAACLGARFAGLEGLRVPGTLDGFEMAVRAILGQQITVAAARTLTTRLVHSLGQPMATPFAGLTHVFPSAAQIAAADDQALSALGSVGIVRQRQGAILALAQAVASGALVLRPGGDVQGTMAALQALPGIGPWTASYIAMRALRWPDAFPAGDVALHSALGLRQHKAPAREAERLSQAWRPWRSYAVLRAWHTLSHPTPHTP